MPSPKLARLALLLPLTGLAACAIPTPSPTEGTPKVALEAFKPIANSPKAPCRVQKEIAEHNSVYETLRNGKQVTYLAPCVVDGQHFRPSPPAPPASS
jgi:hypothetical protein